MSVANTIKQKPNPSPLDLAVARMVWCKHCAKKVTGCRPYDSALACDLCGRILENYNFSEEVTFIKNAAGQSQASGNIVSSVQSGITSSRARRSRIARDELMNLRDALQIGDQDDVVGMASRLFDVAADQNFTKGRRSELVLSSCLYLTCRKKNLPVLLIDFSSYLRVCVYELGHVYLQLCELLYLVDNPNLEELVDPSIFIPRFTNGLLKGAHDYRTTTQVMETATNIIASMKRDWMQTGRKPSGICGAAIYIAALSHGIICSTTDIAHIVHMCGATIAKRLNEFANTEAASLTVDELNKSETILREEPFTPRANSDKEVVNCKHKDSERFDYGLCKDCHVKFMRVSGGIVGGSDPPAFQRAEKERMEKAAREENEEGIEKSEGKGETYWKAEASDESDNLSDLDGDPVVDGCFLDEDEKQAVKKSWEFLNGDWLKEQAAKEAALKTANEAFNASNGNCPEHARNLVEASKASVAKCRKEKRQKRAEEAKNAPPPATALEACSRMLERKKLSRLCNPDLLVELFDSPGEISPKKQRTETVTEKKQEGEIEEEEAEAEEDEEEVYEMNTDEKFYEEDQVEEEEDGYDFGLY